MTCSPEQLTDALLETLLPKVDPERAGTFVEIGCGTGNFSFVMARRLGYKAIATDPVPTAQCAAAAEIAGVSIFAYAIWERNGFAVMHLHDTDPNFASMLPDWNVGNRAKHVQTKTLHTWLVRRPKLESVVCLKLDVEGAENIILRQLKDLPASLLPKIVVFEYGGGGNRSEGKGGWTEEHFANTQECRAILHDLGYIILDRLDSNLGPLMSPCYNELFPPESHYGNLIFAKE